MTKPFLVGRSLFCSGVPFEKLLGQRIGSQLRQDMDASLACTLSSFAVGRCLPWHGLNCTLPRGIRAPLSQK